MPAWEGGCIVWSIILLPIWNKLSGFVAHVSSVLLIHRLAARLKNMLCALVLFVSTTFLNVPLFRILSPRKEATNLFSAPPPTPYIICPIFNHSPTLSSAVQCCIQGVFLLVRSREMGKGGTCNATKYKLLSSSFFSPLPPFTAAYLENGSLWTRMLCIMI